MSVQKIIARAMTIHMMKVSGFWESVPTPEMQERAIAAAIPEALTIVPSIMKALKDAGYRIEGGPQ